MITPIQGRLLVKLKGAYDNLKTTTDERFGTSKTRGELIAVAADIEANHPVLWKLLKPGSIVYFGKYEDTAPYTVDGEDGYILIKLEEIGGVE
jgi:co-chaperonin GroES (HSP10)